MHMYICVCEYSTQNNKQYQRGSTYGLQKFLVRGPKTVRLEATMTPIAQQNGKETMKTIMSGGFTELIFDNASRIRRQDTKLT